MQIAGMKTFKRILMAVKDPETRRQPGIAKAIDLARRLGATLELYHAIHAPVMLELEPVTAKSIRTLREEALGLRVMQLDRHVAAARKRGVKACCTVEWDYPPHEAIARRAASTGADLVVAEWHAGKRTKPWLIHLTDWELLRVCPVPVLLLRTTRPYRRPVVLAAVDPTHARAKPARLDADLIETGSALSVALQGTLHVMHANDPGFLGMASADPADIASMMAAEQALREKARREFELFTAALGTDPARRHLVNGDPVRAIPRLARRLGAHLVVMGALSRSGLERVFIGNTAERILDTLPCDILAVPGVQRGKVGKTRRRLK